MCAVRVFLWACTGVWFDVRAETLTLIPALLLFALAIYLGGLVIYVLKDPNEQKAFSSYALYAFAGGIMLIICWVVYLSLSRRIVRTE
jgi:zinc transporter ZupT